MVAPLSDVPQEGSSVFSLFSLIKLHLASLPLASSYSRVAVSSVFCAQNIYFSAQTRGAPLKAKNDAATASTVFCNTTETFYSSREKSLSNYWPTRAPQSPESLVSCDCFFIPRGTEPARSSSTGAGQNGYKTQVAPRSS